MQGPLACLISPTTTLCFSSSSTGMILSAQQSQLKIVDDEQAKTARAEDLRYDSVVAVNPGMYQCLLEGTDGSNTAKSNLVALNRESYVILRVGVEAQAGQAYPQELVVYPKSDPALLRGAASGASLFA